MLILFLSMLLSIPSHTVQDEIILTYNGKEMRTIHYSEYTLSPVDDLILDQEKYEKLAEELESQVKEEPVNASLDHNGYIVSEKNGHQLNKALFKELFYTSFFSKSTKPIEIPVKTIYPKIGSELLESVRQKKISEYRTIFNPHNLTRTQNIYLASNAINNHVLFPGERFSFNGVVGQRTTDKGYLPAPIIVKGELTEGIGGGICQVSSTLFNAVDLAGVNILERYSHSRSVSYVPPNRDATVSWYGPDFAFKNNYQQPLLIRSKVKKGQLIIEIFSSELFHKNNQ